MDNICKRLELALETLTVFSCLKDSPVLSLYRALLNAAAEGEVKNAASDYANIYHELREGGVTGPGAYLTNLLKYTGTAFAHALLDGTADPGYLAAAERDVAILSEASDLTCADIKAHLLNLTGGDYGDIISALPEWESGNLISFGALLEFYRQNGAGPLARYRALVWTGGTLTPVLSPDPIRYDDMVGYTWQRQVVLDNTRALVRGSAVNNVLLYGDSGTGKSATVKSMLNVAEFQNLSLIEIHKQGFSGLPALLDMLSRQPRKFILFIDDLSFEAGDPDYSALKVILEGGLGQRPRNTVLCVTSNRRQLVKRSFSDRDDMNSGETVEEKTSLADRFAIRLPFFSLNQEEYLATAEALLRQAGIDIDDDALKKEALQWALEHGSRTPRTARQFADEMTAIKIRKKKRDDSPAP